MKKPMFVEIKRAEGPLFINSQDLKVVEIETENHTTSIVTSHGAWDGAKLSQYAIDKLRKELRERYNVVQVDRNGIRVETNAHKNPIFFIKEDNRLVIVWPKAMRQIRLSDGVITLAFDGAEVDIPTDKPVDELTESLRIAGGLLSAADEEA